MNENSGVERRDLLRAGGALGVTVVAGGALAACGGDASSSGSGGSPTGAGAGVRPTGAIAPAAEVPVGGGKVVVNADGTKVVVTQPVAGDFKAFSAVCTHQGCTVSSVRQNKIFCPCHGSEFDGSTGAVVAGPARAPLAAVQVSVTDGTVSFA